MNDSDSKAMTETPQPAGRRSENASETGPLHGLPGALLLMRTHALVRQQRLLDAELIAHLMEIEDRKLHLERACSSLFTFCVRELLFSEDAAYNRVTIVGLARKHPEVLEVLREGRVHMTGLRLLAPHLDAGNVSAVLQEATGRTKREIRVIVARLAPKPDVPDRIVKRPQRRTSSERQHGEPTPAAAEEASAANRENDHGALAARPSITASATDEEGPSSVRREPDVPAPLANVGNGSGQLALAPVDRPKVEISPLSPDRYKVEFTASEALCDKLREAQALVRHQVPGGDLAEVIDRALTLLVNDLKKKRFGVGRKPRPGKQPKQGAASRHIPAEIRRAVYERDGGRCAFVAADGQRCGERSFLELHHLDGFEIVKEHRVDRIELRCAAHNQYEADLMYGREKMNARRQAERDNSVRESPSPFYGMRRGAPPERTVAGTEAGTSRSASPSDIATRSRTGWASSSRGRGVRHPFQNETGLARPRPDHASPVPERRHPIAPPSAGPG